MGKNYYPSMAERSIARILRNWRNETSLSLAEVTDRAGISGSTLSLVENALQPPDPLDVMQLGCTYKLSHAIWKKQARRACDAERKRAGTEDGSVSAELDAVKDFHEACLEAVTVRAFGADMIPRLFQAPAYEQAAVKLGCPAHGPGTSAQKSELAERWHSRVSSDEGPVVVVEVLVTHAAIRRVVGDATTTNAALLRLVQLSKLERVTIQVVDDEDCPEAQVQGSYFHLAFPHPQHRDVVYLENSGKGRYVEDADVCRIVLQGFRSLQRGSLPPEQSTEAIAHAADLTDFNSIRHDQTKV